MYKKVDYKEQRKGTISKTWNLRSFLAGISYLSFLQCALETRQV